jgi:hypothetical protein
MLESGFKLDCLVVAYVVDYVCTPSRLAQNSASAGLTGNTPLASVGGVSNRNM